MRGLIVDNFAGGGGASLGMEWAMGRPVDIAINHDPEAIAMHRANHPKTKHFCESVWDIDPVKVCAGHPVDLAWFSPDCKHFSKAKGGKPVDRRIRGLAWVAVRWAEKVKPAVIVLENVEEFQSWGPTRNGKPVKGRKGETFGLFVRRLRRLGYEVDWRMLRACDYGSPTIRRRLFMVARCDGRPISWPEPTHGEADGLEPFRTAAECIDWSIPCPSIFERKRPLAENTLKRIAAGIQRFVVDHPDPFIVSYYGARRDGEFRGFGVDEPLRTATAENRFGLVTPFIAKVNHGYGFFRGQKVDDPLQTLTGKTGYSLVAPFIAKHYTGVVGADARRPLPTTLSRGAQNQLVAASLVKHNFGSKPCQDLDGPLHTVTTQGNRFGLTTAHLVRHFGQSVGQEADRPGPTITAGGMGKTGLVTGHLVKHYGRSCGQGLSEPAHTLTARGKLGLMSSNLVKLYGTCRHGQDVREPMAAVTAGGLHIGEVRAFLIKYYGQGVGQDLREPAHTLTAKDRLGLVTVAGEEYVIADIGMRMLQPAELFAAQGFPPDYKFQAEYDRAGQLSFPGLGKPLTKQAQVRMVGNSVCPQVAEAVVRANWAEAAGRVAA